MIRVALVDDDALVRAGLRMILGGAPDLRVVGEPDRLRSIFVNGIKHLPVALAGTDAARGL